MSALAHTEYRIGAGDTPRSSSPVAELSADRVYGQNLRPPSGLSVRLTHARVRISAASSAWSSRWLSPQESSAFPHQY
eukprot:5571517-Prymnesium_polylepis.3